MVVTALTAIAAPSALHAQTSSTPAIAPVSSSVVLTMGSEHVTQRNFAVSPLRYSGAGATAALRVRRVGHRYALLTDISAGALSLGSPRVASVARVSYADFGVSLNRAMLSRRALRIDGGIAAGAHVTLTKHEFAIQSVSPTRTRIAAMSLGPRIGVQRIERWGTVHGAVALPAIALIDRPYAASKNAYAGFSPRFVSARQAQTFVGDASFTTSGRARMGMQIGVRSRFFAHDDGQPVRTIANTYSAGLVIRSRRHP